MDCSQPGSTDHGILQVRILEWVAISSSRGSSQPRDQTCISCTGRQVLYHWAIREACLIKVHGGGKKAEDAKSERQSPEESSLVKCRNKIACFRPHLSLSPHAVYLILVTLSFSPLSALPGMWLPGTQLPFFNLCSFGALSFDQIWSNQPWKSHWKIFNWIMLISISFISQCPWRLQICVIVSILLLFFRMCINLHGWLN